MKDTWATCIATAPVNDPMNAMHRGGRSGTTRRGRGTGTAVAVGHHTVGRVTNDQDHAIYVELGTVVVSTKMQIFSWTECGGASYGRRAVEGLPHGPPLTRAASWPSTSASAGCRRRSVTARGAARPSRPGRAGLGPGSQGIAAMTD